MKSGRRKPSPRACPRCGTVRVARVDGTWRCQRDDGTCGYESKQAFPTVGGLGTSSNRGNQVMQPDGNSKGMGGGCYMVRPAGNKYS